MYMPAQYFSTGFPYLQCTEEGCSKNEWMFASSVFLIAPWAAPWIICTHHSNLTQQLKITVVIFLLGSPLMFIATVPKCFTNIKALFLCHSPGHAITPLYWSQNAVQGKRLKISPSAYPDGGMGVWFSAHPDYCSQLELHKLQPSVTKAPVPS